MFVTPRIYSLFRYVIRTTVSGVKCYGVELNVTSNILTIYIRGEIRDKWGVDQNIISSEGATKVYSAEAHLFLEDSKRTIWMTRVMNVLLS